MGNTGHLKCFDRTVYMKSLKEHLKFLNHLIFTKSFEFSGFPSFAKRSGLKNG